MNWDLKIVGGTVVDGTGRPTFNANVAVKDGRIVEIGPCDGSALNTIDADGAIVTPGFVDIHTHYDGQSTWDPEMLPSAQHGVTTAIMGNCGVGFAPVHDADHERLIHLMEGVEDIPGAALAEGCAGAGAASLITLTHSTRCRAPLISAPNSPTTRCACM
jgi:N-acyl-D-aspartate/D-glutamate deacylase